MYKSNIFIKYATNLDAFTYFESCHPSSVAGSMQHKIYCLLILINFRISWVGYYVYTFNMSGINAGRFKIYKRNILVI